MNLKQRQLLRLVENSFPNISNFYDQVEVHFELLENAKSFWSEIFVAHLTVMNGEDLGLPKNVFIKIPKLTENSSRAVNKSARADLIKSLIALNKKENQFYNSFNNANVPYFPIPKMYYCEEMDDEGTGGLVAENLADKTHAVEYIPGFDDDQVLRLMEALAGFHSHTIKLNSDEFMVPFREGFGGREIFSPRLQTIMFDEACQLEVLRPEIFGNGRIRNLKWAFDYDLKNKTLAKAVKEIPRILVHSDLNATNLLWNNNDDEMLGAIIDYQHVHEGSVAEDLIRILSLGVSVENRRKHTTRYLKHYHNTLTSLFDGVAPISFEQLNQQYRDVFPFISNFSLLGISLYCKMYMDGTLGTEENKLECCDELISRAVGIVEDIENLS